MRYIAVWAKDKSLSYAINDKLQRRFPGDLLIWENQLSRAVKNITDYKKYLYDFINLDCQNVWEEYLQFGIIAGKPEDDLYLKFLDEIYSPETKIRYFVIKMGNKSPEKLISDILNYNVSVMVANQHGLRDYYEYIPPVIKC